MIPSRLLILHSNYTLRRFSSQHLQKISFFLPKRHPIGVFDSYTPIQGRQNEQVHRESLPEE